MVSAHPDHGIVVSRRLDIRRLKKTFEEAEQIAAVSFGPSNFHEIKHIGVFPLIYGVVKAAYPLGGIGSHITLRIPCGQ
jgi:hypothetical protein